MLAQHARRTRLKHAESKDKNATLAQVVDTRLAQHGVDAEKISWDAYRREDGTWRIVATWPSGKAIAQAVWELDKARQQVTAHDDMAQYLSVDRPSPLLGQDPTQRHGNPISMPSRGESSRGDLARNDGGHGGHEPMRPAADTARRETRPGRGLGAPDPVRAGRDALLASLERPLGSGPGEQPIDTAAKARPMTRSRANVSGPAGAFDSDPDQALDIPVVPSLAVLRPRRAAQEPTGDTPDGAEKPRKRAPSWDDVLFGTAPARETS
jgi:hypothetical protein